MVIANEAGSATSSNASLTVVVSPWSQTNIAGATATFTVTVFGPEPLNYQWLRNGTNLVEGGSGSAGACGKEVGTEEGVKPEVRLERP